MSDNKWIDLRSDTVTQPTQQMREAMYQAQVGDDVYGDDPTVNQLEKKAAEMMGKEAALFVASGTMGNAVAVMSHTKRGDEIILSDTAHIVAHEVGGAAVLAQAFIRTLHFENGIFDAEQMAAAVRDSSNIHFPPTGLICVEEPLATGKVVPLNVLQEVYRMAQQKGIPVHMDGARISNAAAALGVSLDEVSGACGVDTLTLGGTKNGLMGAECVVVFNPDLMKEARYARKQACQLASKMRYISCQFTAFLTDNLWLRCARHANEMAAKLAEALQAMPDVTFTQPVESNQLFFIMPREKEDKLQEFYHFYFWNDAKNEMRLVTSWDTTDEDIDLLIERIKLL